MLTIERQQAILEYIRQQHSASVSELSQRFFMSETSIRRDLQKLERAGMIHKTYGGAVIIQGDNEVVSLAARQQVEREAKNMIAKKAAALVENGDVIFLDSSSTTLSMVPHLASLTSLSVITNGLRVANALADYPHFKVYMLGGLLNSRTYSIRGALTCQQLMGMYANRAFISPKGVDEHGTIYCADEEEAYARLLMMQKSDTTVLLCSHRKLGIHAAFRLCGLSDIHSIVCEAPPETEWCDLFAKNDTVLI